MQNNIKNLIPINTILKDKSEILHALICHSDNIKKIQKTISHHLEPPLSQQFIVANYNSEAIILHANSSAWASKLRFNIPKILNIAQSHCGLAKLQSIRIKVVPVIQRKATQYRKLELSKQSRQLISEIADNIDSEEVRTSLLRLTKL